MTTGLYTDPAGLAHETPEGHPEQIARLRVIQDALADPAFDALARLTPPIAGNDPILRCHPQSHIDALEAAAPARGIAPLDADTWISPGSLNASRMAVGGNLAAIDAVMAGDLRNAFIAMRPPGHHAETAKTMGFCLFGTIAIAAKYALEVHGLTRVAIVDFDVHHGNGTQDLLWDEPRVRFVSSHQMPLWPGSGDPSDVGAHGQILNVPLPPRSDGALMRQRYERDVLPMLDAFAPELVLISAGFDAHAADPLAELMWDEDDFIWLTHKLCDLADTHAQGRVVSTLEGGYDLTALAASVAAHVKVLMERGA